MNQKYLTLDDLTSLPPNTPVKLQRQLTPTEIQELSGIGDYSNELCVLEGNIITRDQVKHLKQDRAIGADGKIIYFNDLIEKGYSAQLRSFDEFPAEISKYDVGDEISIIRTRQIQGVYAWVVASPTRMTLNKDGEWDFEPIPSSRSRAYLDNTRFKTAEEAWEVFRKERTAHYLLNASSNRQNSP